MTRSVARLLLLRRAMKTNSNKKLTLDLETVRTLTDETMARIIGGQKMPIVSTDTPSVCFDCTTFGPSFACTDAN